MSVQQIAPEPVDSIEITILADHPFYDLALARRPATILLRPRPAGVVLRGGRNERTVELHPQPLPLDPREALVGQVGAVAVEGYKGVAYGPLVRSRRSQTESGDDAPSGSTTNATLKP